MKVSDTTSHFAPRVLSYALEALILIGRLLAFHFLKILPNSRFSNTKDCAKHGVLLVIYSGRTERSNEALDAAHITPVEGARSISFVPV